ncbi:MAG: hypothetical protein M3Y27_19460 [Acidobacteriota bacterium]|nr:hypothetical protein [Acidobacteriota bacterium]
MPFFIGLDLGQKQDYTAIAIIETASQYTGLDWRTYEHHYLRSVNVRHLERIRLGTSYLAVVERLRQVVNSRELIGRCTVVMDATGLGGPVLDLLRAAGLGCEIVPVTITGGDRETYSGGMWRVPKRDLINRLQLLFERKELQIASRLREAETFARELMNMRIKVSVAGHDSYAAARASNHDDLVLAVALACWRAKGNLSRPVFGTRSLGLDY